jgi:O-antigen/teichoic acid export membrane protein
MESRFKQLGKDSIIYGVGGIFAKGINFFLLPLYTRILTPAEYGTIEMLLVINAFLGALLTIGMDSAQSFYFFEQQKNGRLIQAQVITAILQWRLVWGVIIVGAGMLLSPLLNAYFFNGQLAWEYFAFAFIGHLFLQTMEQSAGVFRLLYRPWPYIGITISHAIMSAGITIIFMVWLNWGVLGYLVGFGAGSLMAALFGWWAIRTYIDWSHWHYNWWPRLLRFGIPFVPGALAIYILTGTDRWFISYYLGQNTLGLYSVGANFASIIALAVVTYRQAWWPIALDAMHSTDGPQLFRTMGRLYLGFGSIGIIWLTWLSPLLIRLFTSPAYHAASPIIGILAWYAIFYGFYLIAAGGIWKQEKTIWIPINMGIAALLNIALNFLLIPQFGNMGAAAATSISSFIWNILVIVVSEKLWPVSYPLGVFGLQIGLGVAAMVGIQVMYSLNYEMWRGAILAIIVTGVLIGVTLENRHIKWLFRQFNNWQIPVITSNTPNK